MGDKVLNVGCKVSRDSVGKRVVGSPAGTLSSPVGLFVVGLLLLGGGGGGGGGGVGCFV